VVLDPSDHGVAHRKHQLLWEKTYGLKRMNHPIVGELELSYETFASPSDPNQTMVLYTAKPCTTTAERLAVL
jgi:MmyB-like transcription regulator ligand binding domain